MRSLTALFGFALAVCLVSTSPVSAQVATFDHAFAVPAYANGVLAHSDGTLWIATTRGLFRYTLGGTLLGQVSGWECYGPVEASGGDVVVADYAGNRILRYSAGGTLVSEFPTVGVRANNVALDPAGNVYSTHYVTPNYLQSEVRKYSPAGVLLASSPLASSAGVVVRDGAVYVTEQATGLVHVFDTDLVPTRTFTTATSATQQLSCDRYGQLFLADLGTRTVQVRTTAGALIGTIGPTLAGYGAIHPSGIAVTDDSRIVIADFWDASVIVLAAGATPTIPDTWGRLKSRYR